MLIYRSQNKSTISAIFGIDARRNSITVLFVSNVVANHSLHFIYGKHKGGVYTLVQGSDVLIGNGSDTDLVLMGELVSKKHGAITWEGGDAFLQDLGSIHGLYVNGDKVTKVKLEDGDEILVGTNLLRFSAKRSTAPPPIPSSSIKSSPSSGVDTMLGLLTGDIEDVNLTELLQMLAISRRSGILRLSGEDDGEIYLRKGHIYWASLSRSPDLSPYKAIHRILGWRKGTFGLVKAEDQSFDGEITDSVDSLIMDSIQQEDIMAELQERAPGKSARILPTLTRSGQPEHAYRSIYALICNDTYTVQELLDHSQDSDAETMRQLVELLEQGWVRAR